MASQTCWRCLIRPARSLNGLAAAIQPRSLFQETIHAFSTTASRSSRAAKLKKERIAARKNKGKPPAPGERKAMRKTIVLSNTNALTVPTVKEMTAENTSEAEQRGAILAMPDKIVSRLRAAELFQTKQMWKMFRRVSIVLRSADIRLAQMMDDGRENKKVIRQVLVGDRGAGKSLYILQAAASAMLKDWIVVTIPEAQELILANTDYGPIPQVRPIMYQQKAYTAAMLQRIINANPSLADMPVVLEHQFPVSIPSQLTIAKLAALGVSDTGLAQSIFEAVIRELTAPGRPPMLITLDGFNHINSLSAYRSASFQQIHAHDLYIPAWFISMLSGRSALPNGGAVLAAMTRSNGPHVKTLDARLEQLEKQQSVRRGTLVLDPQTNPSLPYLIATGQEHLATQVPDLDPYVRHDTRVLEIFSNTNTPQLAAGETQSSTSEKESNSERNSESNLGANTSSTLPLESSWSALTPADSNVEIKRIHGLTKVEAKALMEYWALSGILRTEISERFVGEQWSISGGGLPGELEKTCLSMRY